jgi:hypothetical protein
MLIQLVDPTLKSIWAEEFCSGDFIVLEYTRNIPNKLIIVP